MKKYYTFKITSLTAILVCWMLLISAHRPEEGMFPLNELSKLDLKKAGLQLTQEELFNPNGTSLVEALVQLSGCTGSFISDKGLIITNHHCAFEAVQMASTPEQDFLNNGFVAATHEQEIQAKGLTCRITESYEDVSARILASVAIVTDPNIRIKTINETMAAIVKEEEAKDKTIKAEVSEMFIGKSYVLFRYKTIQDVRLVYVPRWSIGEFGGESDNWVWPRHTGDFSFVRAYVASDGSTAPYSKSNVPYKPKRYLKVNANGVNDEDFVFILGYPGRTYRHKPWQYLEYQRQYLLPYISTLYDWQINQMLQVSDEDRQLELKQATRIKRIANVMKNYKGKLQGLNRIGLVEQKRNEDKQMQNFIEANAELKGRYGNLMKDIDVVYREISSDAMRDLWFTQLYPSNTLLAVANSIEGLKTKLRELPEDKRDAYLDENRAKLKTTIEQLYGIYVEATDRRLLKRTFTDALQLLTFGVGGTQTNQRIDFVDTHFKNLKKGDEKVLEAYVSKLFGDTKLKDKEFAMKLLDGNIRQIMNTNDVMMETTAELNKQFDEIKQTRQKREGTLNKLMADYVDVKSLWKNKSFVPDANSTLRFTYGYVRGYTPADAVYNGPFTTLKGLLEKGNTGADYEMPAIIKDLYDKKDFGNFKHPKLNDVPIAFLYNLDTSGGNSGSPVMNAKGELIGVNFDRSYSATINDFAWNESYSRAIGVDIRYVLWVAQKVDKANFILKELGIPE